MRGRKTIPTAIKELKGTLEKSRVLENEMKVSVINEIPEPSEDLNEEGRKIWENVCHELKRNGILSTVDLDLVESYCQEMAMYKHATRQLKNKGAVYKLKLGVLVLILRNRLSQKLGVVLIRQNMAFP